MYLISAESENPVGDYKVLKKELKNFSENMRQKSFLIAISKSEIINDEKKAEIKKSFQKIRITPIFFSSVTRENLDQLLQKTFKLIA